MSDRIENNARIGDAGPSDVVESPLPARATSEAPPRRPRGFGAMDPARQKELASRGGRAAHQKGRGHEWDREQAREAGRKGGLASRGGRGKLTPPSGGETT